MHYIPPWGWISDTQFDHQYFSLLLLSIDGDEDSTINIVKTVSM